MDTIPTIREQTLEKLDLAVDQAVPPLTVTLTPSDESAINLLRDIIVDEYDSQHTGHALEVDLGTFTGALQSALERVMHAPREPWDRAARVTCRRLDDPINEVHQYARIGEVWVSPSDNTGRTWHDLLVEYDVLDVEGG